MHVISCEGPSVTVNLCWASEPTWGCVGGGDGGAGRVRLDGSPCAGGGRVEGREGAGKGPVENKEVIITWPQPGSLIVITSAARPAPLSASCPPYPMTPLPEAPTIRPDVRLGPWSGYIQLTLVAFYFLPIVRLCDIRYGYQCEVMYVFTEMGLGCAGCQKKR